MDDSFTNDPTGYIARIQRFSSRRSGYQPLADFLHRAVIDSRISESADRESECFVWFYAIHGNRPLSMDPLLSPSVLRNINADSVSSACSGRLIFLRGYPSPKWLAHLGYIHQVNPEYWKRHLNFLYHSVDAFPRERLLPSDTSCTFQLRINSIGALGRWWQPHRSIETLRRSAAIEMEAYSNNLRAGRNWKQADSVVRRYVLHDREHFSIEQHITVHLRSDRLANQWTIFVFTDCSSDLSTSPAGPWLDGLHSDGYPKILCAPDEGAETILSNAPRHMTENYAETTPQQLRQSLSQIHLDYGKTLRVKACALNPFYLLIGIFQQDVHNESLVLDLMVEKVKRLTTRADSKSIKATNHEPLHSQLLHFQSFLELRVEILEDKADLIRRRGGASWPRLKECEGVDVAESAIILLIEDFEHLLKRTHSLLTKIERSISLTMSLANIEEARRGIEQNTILFRFTVVASFYIPLSFATSFFGMNFNEFGTGTLSIWLFFALSVPVFIISVICLFIRGSWVNLVHDKISYLIRHL